MNETFNVASMVHCDQLTDADTCNEDYLLRETQVGCKVLLLLQEMYKFNINYIEAPLEEISNFERTGTIYEFDEPVDIYAKPRTFWSVTLYNASPIMHIFSWRFGYILRRADPDIGRFYSQPFSITVWNCLLAMIVLVSVLLYIFSRAEQRFLGGDWESFSYSLLVTLGAYCQHYLLVTPVYLTSRRIAIFSFFLFTYVIYSYYASTLLSELVHDKNNEMNLRMLAASSYESLVYDKVALVIEFLVNNYNRTGSAFSPIVRNFIEQKFNNMRVVNITTGLEEVKTGQKALLSDYTSLYTTIRHVYDNQVICELLEVDLFSNIMKYFLTSKNFKYVEEFKIGTLRAKETGILQRLLENDAMSPLECVQPHFQAQFEHIQVPLVVLAICYILSVLMLFGELIHFKRNRVWPYVE